MIRFVIPAYNEAENIPRLLDDLAPRARELGARVIFVDDGSTDGTGEAIKHHRDGPPPRRRAAQANRGLGTAINSGLRAALGEAHDDDAIVTIEADNTSDLDDLPRMLELLRARATTSCSPRSTRPAARSSASRRWRLAASKAVSNTFRHLGGLQEIHTLSSLYRVYRAGTLRRAAETYGYLLVREPGFAANVELLLKLYNAGATVAEVPTVNDWSRRSGRLEDDASSRPSSPTAGWWPRTSSAASSRRRSRRCAEDIETPDRSASASPSSSARREPAPRRDPRRRCLGTRCALRRQAGAESRCSSAAPRSAASRGRWTSAATGSTASTTWSSPRTSACSRSPTSSASPTRCASARSASASTSTAEMHPFNGLGDFARFPPLSPLGRARLAWFVLQCQLRRRLRGARGHAARALAAAALRPQGRRAHLAPAAGLALRRPATTSCPPPTSGRAPAACAARGRRAAPARRWAASVGGHERLIEAIGDRARSLGVDIRLGAGRRGARPRQRRRGHGRPGRRRGVDVRPHDRDAPAAGACAGSCPSSSTPARAYPKRYPRGRVPRDEGQASRCCPTTR